MILDIEVGNDELTVKEVKLHTPFTARHWIRLKYAHLPKLPLNDGFNAAISFGYPVTITIDIPPFSSMEQQCDYINSFRDNQTPSQQLLWAFYDGREFELCTGSYMPVVLSQALVDFLKMPSALMATQTCWSSALFNDTLRTYSHWNVYVKNLQGVYNGMDHTELLAKVRDDGTIYGEAHNLLSDVRNLQVSVLPVSIYGVIGTGYTANGNLSIGLEFGT